MKYYLDTNICIYFLKGEYPNILKKLSSTNPNDIKIPAIVKAELLYGALKSKQKKNNLARIDAFLRPFELEEFDNQSAEVYGHIRYSLEKKGTPIGPNDLLIASIVQANEGVLVTNNESEFKRVTGLKIENWTSE
ncbi:MAG: type II toxin-antitoxin system VapC family toxin [Bacteroidetes bacterium]|nr:type II toxin-antitoxin system VapC family toxin [Bacteroidota bacterium]